MYNIVRLSKKFHSFSKDSVSVPNYIGVLSKKGLPSPKLNSNNVYYMPEFNLGELINSGREANVYSIKGYDGIVARVPKDTYFAPHKLRPTPNQAVDLYASVDNKVLIQKRIQGEPLHGKFWDISAKPSIEEFNKSLDALEKLPDEAFEKYIDDVLKLRAVGKDVDTINPNNFLLDNVNKRINIVDVETQNSYYKKYNVDSSDFYQFVDSRRLFTLLFDLSSSEKEVLIKRVRNFFDRVALIGEKKGLDLSMEPIDYNKLQNNVVYLYHNEKSMMRGLGL